MATLREQFLALDDALASHGVPPCSAWWRREVGGWLDKYEQSGVLELLACAGRGSAKSTVLYKLALFFALFVPFAVPEDERHYAIILSRLKEEAAKGLAIIDKWLTHLGEGHRLAGDTIELSDQPRGIRVVAASVAAASGWRAFFVGKDERSKWPASGIEEQDAAEIDTSAGSMTATHPNAPTVTVGSAWGNFGEFYEAVTGGSNEHRHVAGPASTWEAAPHLTEADCRKKERDPRRFAREYGSKFQAGALAAIDIDDVRACVRALPNARVIGQSALCLDLSSGGGDSVGWATVTPVDDGGRRVLRVTHLQALEGAFRREIDFATLIARIADSAHTDGAKRAYFDQWLGYATEAEFARHGIGGNEHPWSAPAKVQAIAQLRMLCADRSIAFEPGSETEKLVVELGQLQETFTPSGELTVKARRSSSGHADRASVALMIALTESRGCFFSGRPDGRSGTVWIRELRQTPTHAGLLRRQNAARLATAFQSGGLAGPMGGSYFGGRQRDAGDDKEWKWFADEMPSRGQRR